MIRKCANENLAILLRVIFETLHLLVTVEKLCGLEPNAFCHRHQLALSLIKSAQLIAQFELIGVVAEKLTRVKIGIVERFDAAIKIIAFIETSTS